MRIGVHRFYIRLRAAEGASLFLHGGDQEERVPGLLQEFDVVVPTYFSGCVYT